VGKGRKKVLKKLLSLVSGGCASGPVSVSRASGKTTEERGSGGKNGGLVPFWGITPYEKLFPAGCKGMPGLPGILGAGIDNLPAVTLSKIAKPRSRRRKREDKLSGEKRSSHSPPGIRFYFVPKLPGRVGKIGKGEGGGEKEGKNATATPREANRYEHAKKRGGGKRSE